MKTTFKSYRVNSPCPKVPQGNPFEIPCTIIFMKNVYPKLPFPRENEIHQKFQICVFTFTQLSATFHNYQEQSVWDQNLATESVWF